MSINITNLSYTERCELLKQIFSTTNIVLTMEGSNTLSKSNEVSVSIVQNHHRVMFSSVDNTDAPYLLELCTGL